MTNIEQLVLVKMQALSIDQQESVLHFIEQLSDSNILQSDEVDNPSPEQIAASLRRALQEVKTGQTKPISQLWDNLDGN